MPLSVHGFGTAYYGERDHLVDDCSFITTEWIICLNLPVIPLRSLRVIPDFAESAHNPVVSIEAYHTAKRVPLCLRQVFQTYLFILGCLAWWCLLAWGTFTTFNVEDSKQWVPMIAILAVLGPSPFFVLWFLRRRAMKARLRVRTKA